MNTDRVRALVIDDIADSRNIMQRLLTLLGCDACGAGDGKAGIELAARIKPQLILLDLAMPFMDGFEVAKHLKCLRLPPHLLVALTGHDDLSTKQRCIEAGFSLHVCKPVSEDVLPALIQSARQLSIGVR